MWISQKRNNIKHRCGGRRQEARQRQCLSPWSIRQQSGSFLTRFHFTYSQSHKTKRGRIWNLCDHRIHVSGEV